MSSTRSDQIQHYLRYEHNGKVSFGLAKENTVQPISDAPYRTWSPFGQAQPLNEIQLLPPVDPPKIIAVGLNYRSHLGSRKVPVEPQLFAKLPSCLIGDGHAIHLPEDADTVHCEAELVLVIGKQARNVSVEDAQEHVFGVTCGNDVSARSWQRTDLQWLRAKSTDTFGPLGPVLTHGIDLDDLGVQGHLNGVTVQSGRTSDFIFSIAELVAFASRYITLQPGDLIFTGTPGQTVAVKAGDVFDVVIDGIGTLSNPVS